jgi:hypothetical protein
MWLSKHSNLPFFATCALLSIAAPAAGELVTYEFIGHVVVQTNSPGGDWMNLNGTAFTARLSYDLSPSGYSADWQVGNPRYGQYLTYTPGTSFSLNANGMSFESTGAETGTDLTVINDSIGPSDPPEFQGDVFQIYRRAFVTMTDPGVDNGTFYVPPGTFTVPYSLAFVAKDSTRSAFSDDLLKTAIDFTQFNDLRIHIVPIVPRSGSDPPEPYQTNVDAIVDSILVVPEPSGWLLLFVGALWHAACRRRHELWSAPTRRNRRPP